MRIQQANLQHFFQVRKYSCKELKGGELFNFSCHRLADGVTLQADGEGFPVGTEENDIGNAVEAEETGDVVIDIDNLGEGHPPFCHGVHGVGDLVAVRDAEHVEPLAGILPIDGLHGGGQFAGFIAPGGPEEDEGMLPLPHLLAPAGVGEDNLAGLVHGEVGVLEAAGRGRILRFQGNADEQTCDHGPCGHKRLDGMLHGYSSSAAGSSAGSSTGSSVDSSLGTGTSGSSASIMGGRGLMITFPGVRLGFFITG